jgi:hypothetical protein
MLDSNTDSELEKNNFDLTLQNKKNSIKVQNKSKRINDYISQYPIELTKTPRNELLCKLCQKTVNSDSKFTINAHLKSIKHLNERESLKEKREAGKNEQSLLDFDNKTIEFSKRVLEAFSSADIPLYKLRNKKMRFLFNYMGNPLPSESTTRRSVNILYEETIEKIRQLIKGLPVF